MLSVCVYYRLHVYRLCPGLHVQTCTTSLATAARDLLLLSVLSYIRHQCSEKRKKKTNLSQLANMYVTCHTAEDSTHTKS